MAAHMTTPMTAAAEAAAHRAWLVQDQPNAPEATPAEVYAVAITVALFSPQRLDAMACLDQAAAEVTARLQAACPRTLDWWAITEYGDECRDCGTVARAHARP